MVASHVQWICHCKRNGNYFNLFFYYCSFHLPMRSSFAWACLSSEHRLDSTRWRHRHTDPERERKRTHKWTHMLSFTRRDVCKSEPMCWWFYSCIYDSHAINVPSSNTHTDERSRVTQTCARASEKTYTQYTQSIGSCVWVCLCMHNHVAQWCVYCTRIPALTHEILWIAQHLRFEKVVIE